MKIPQAVLIVFAALFSVSLAAADVRREGWHVAHVGSTIRITLSFDVVPNEAIETVKVFVDDQPIKQPEIVRPAPPKPTKKPTAKPAPKPTATPASKEDAKPARGEITFIYHPAKRGKHRVDVLPVIPHSDGHTRIHPPKVFQFFVY